MLKIKKLIPRLKEHMLHHSEISDEHFNTLSIAIPQLHVPTNQMKEKLIVSKRRSVILSSKELFLREKHKVETCQREIEIAAEERAVRKENARLARVQVE
jgi:hypothetical protein